MGSRGSAGGFKISKARSLIPGGKGHGYTWSAPGLGSVSGFKSRSAARSNIMGILKKRRKYPDRGAGLYTG